MTFSREAIVQTFVAETEESLATVEAAVVELERRPGDTELLSSIFRAVHTLKGDSFSLGFAGVGEGLESVDVLRETEAARGRAA